MRRSVFTSLLLLALGVGSVACGDPEPDAPTQVVHDLEDPYQPRPFAIDALLVTEAERLCRDPSIGIVPAGAPLVVVDARGENHLFLLFGGPGVDAQCFLHREEGGQLVTDGGGSGIGTLDQPFGPDEIVHRGTGTQSELDPGGGERSTGFVLGRAGSNIVRVEVTLTSGMTLTASLNRGWFGAWWLGKDEVTSIRGFDAANRPLGSYP